MRFPITVISSLLLAWVSVPVQSGDESQALSRQVRAYFADMRSGHLEGIERTLADDYLVIGGDGKLENRAERLAWLRTNIRDLAGIRASELTVRSYGDTGIVLGLVEIPREGNAPPVRERFTQVWVKDGVAWKMVSGQITVVKGQAREP